MFEFDNDIPLCPICNAEMKAGAARRNQLLDIVCHKNTCFRFIFDYGDIEVRIFDKIFEAYDEDKPYIPEAAQKEITYWKENDRYLMKLLE